MHDDDDRGIFALPGLPVALREQLGFRIDLEQPGFGGREIEAPRQKGGSNSHGVAAFQERVRLKGKNFLFHIETVFHQGTGNKSKMPPGVNLSATGGRPNPLGWASIEAPMLVIYGFLYHQADELRKFI